MFIIFWSESFCTEYDNTENVVEKSVQLLVQKSESTLPSLQNTFFNKLSLKKLTDF